MKPYSKDVWKEGYTPESWSEHQSFVFWAKVISVIAVLILLLVLFPIRVTFAQERHHRATSKSPSAPVQVPFSMGSPTATPVLVTNSQSTSTSQVANTSCISALHDDPTTPSAIMAEIKAVKAAGFNCVRLAYQNFNNPYSEQGALDAKSLGMYVILGAEWGTFTQPQFSQYESEALTQFKWCQANGIQQCSLGNEQEARLSGLTLCQWYSDLQSMSVQMHSVYSGEISYEMNSQYANQYNACGPRGLIVYGENLYGGYAYNANMIQQGIDWWGVNGFYVSESGPDMDTGWYNTDALRAAEVSQDFALLVNKFPSTKLFFFTWSANGSTGVPTMWGLYNGTTLQDPLTLKAL